MHINTQSGFSLIQLSVVIIIVSLGLGAAAMLASIQFQKDQQTKLIESFDDTSELLLSYYVGLDATGTPNERLPCPALRNLSIEHADFGKENCSGATFVNSTILHPVTGNPMRVMIGALPVKELSMSTEQAFDVFGGQLLYAVSEDMTSNTNFGRTDMAAILRVEEAGGTPIGQPLPFIVVSAGETQRGTYSTNGTLFEACPNGTAEAENCDNNARFLDTTIKEQEGSADFTDDRIGYDGRFLSRIAQFRSLNFTCPGPDEAITGFDNGDPLCSPFESTGGGGGTCPNAENNGAQCSSSSCMNCSDRGDRCVGALVCGICTGGRCIPGSGSR